MEIDVHLFQYKIAQMVHWPTPQNLIAYKLASMLCSPLNMCSGVFLAHKMSLSSYAVMMAQIFKLLFSSK